MSAVVASGSRRPAVALVVGMVALLAFVSLEAVVRAGGYAPLSVDVQWDDLMAANLTDPGLVLAWFPAIVGGTIGMIVIGAVLVALLLWRRRRADAAVVAGAIIVVVAIGATMAAVLRRGRPDDSLAESVPTSFPSGHAAVATTVAVVLGLLLRRWCVWTLGVVWVLWMMWSRTYLHAHWLSDVVAGMLEGIVVATFVWVVAEALRVRHAARSVAGAAREQPIESEPNP